MYENSSGKWWLAQKLKGGNYVFLQKEVKDLLGEFAPAQIDLFRDMVPLIDGS